MAKVKIKPDSPTALTMNLFGAGMSLLHRAGLGGLACTLDYIERAYDTDHLDDSDVPGGPWEGGNAPWTISSSSITLDFGRPNTAKKYLQRLFHLAFGIKNGLIYLPGQYGYPAEPSDAIRAELQQALLLTFLQHGKTRKVAKEASTMQHEIDGQVMPPVEYRKCTSYKHQGGWQELAGNGVLTTKPVEVAGPLNPGAMVRHIAFKADTEIEEMPERILPLYFAAVGCVALCVNRGVGVVLAPDVSDLIKFTAIRPLMTPTVPRDCRIASAGDAALQAQVRVRAKGILAVTDLPSIYAMTFGITPWASKQKSRIATVDIPLGQDTRLDRFELALGELPPRVKSYVKKEVKGTRRQKKTGETVEYFWADSVVRSLVADNLTMDRPWYAGFARLMTARDQSNRPVRDKLGFERKGLHAMIEKKAMFDTDGEALVVQAVHDALRARYGRIAEESRKNAVAMKARWTREYDRWRLAFAGAKTADQFRSALCDLLSRGGSNRALRGNWANLLPLLKDAQWQLARDLSLLALPSYMGTENDDAVATVTPKPKG